MTKIHATPQVPSNFSVILKNTCQNRIRILTKTTEKQNLVLNGQIAANHGKASSFQCVHNSEQESDNYDIMWYHGWQTQRPTWFKNLSRCGI